MKKFINIVTIAFFIIPSNFTTAQPKIILKSISDSKGGKYKLNNGKLLSEYSGADGTTTYVYNKNGLLQQIGNRIFFTYNQDGTIATKKIINPSNPNDVNQQLYNFTYSTNNINEKKYQLINTSVITEENNYTIQNGFIIKKLDIQGKKSDTYTYDNIGNVIFWRNENITANGTVLFHEATYTYDAAPSIQRLMDTSFYGSQVQLSAILLGGTDSHPSVNNRLSAVDVSNYNFKKVAKTSTINFTYTYAKNGYPASTSKANGAGKILIKYYTY